MAEITLEDVWVHDRTNLAVFVHCGLRSVRERASVPGEVRRRAGGRLQAVGRPGMGRILDAVLDYPERDTVDQLREWVAAGREVMYRDPRHRLVFGRIFDLAVDEVAGADEDVAECSFSLQEVTDSAAV